MVIMVVMVGLVRPLLLALGLLFLLLVLPRFRWLPVRHPIVVSFATLLGWLG